MWGDGKTKLGEICSVQAQTSLKVGFRRLTCEDTEESRLVHSLGQLINPLANCVTRTLDFTDMECLGREGAMAET